LNFCVWASACRDAARRWAAAYKDELNIAVANEHSLESAGGLHALSRPPKGAGVDKSIKECSKSRTLRLARTFSSPLRVVCRAGDRYELVARNRSNTMIQAHAADLEFYKLPVLTSHYVSGADLDAWCGKGKLEKGGEVIEAIIEHRQGKD
jgi:hypothetical protein